MSGQRDLTPAQDGALRTLLARRAIHGGLCVTARGLSLDDLAALREAGLVGRAAGMRGERLVVVWWLSRAGLARARQLEAPDSGIVPPSQSGGLP